MTRQEYLFQCTLRNPAAQRELLGFLREFPIFYLLNEAVSNVVPEQLQGWKHFLASWRGPITKINPHGGAAVLRVLPRSPREVVNLADLLEEISTMDDRILWAATTRNVVMRFLERIEPYEGFLGAILQSPANNHYFSLIKSTPSEYARKENEFRKRWGFRPHWPSPRRPPIIAERRWLEFVSSDVKLFIPVTDILTLEELQKRWSEIVATQSNVYGTKRRPGRTQYEHLVKIYDLRGQGLPHREIASQVDLTASAVKTQYRRVHMDIHGMKPSQARQAGSYTSQGGTLKTRTIQYRRREMRASPSDMEMLERASTELGIPLEKLERAYSDPSALTGDEKANLGGWIQDRQRAQLREQEMPKRPISHQD